MPETDKIKQLIGIELPEGEFEILKEEDKDQVRSKYESSKTEIKELINTFMKKGIGMARPILRIFLSAYLPTLNLGLKQE